MFYKQIVKPLLFKLDAEQAHHLIIDGMSLAGRIPGGTALLEALWGVPSDPRLSVDLWGLHFANPIGLAAGLDKNGEAAKAFSSIGFGFIEVGTVTPLPQPGNEQPRLFRLPEDEALINRMGFNNIGAQRMADHLQSLPHNRKIPIAINIGKNKLTPNEDAAEDYRKCIRTLYKFGDFFVINISSPNTPGLRELQYGQSLRKLLEAVKDEARLQRPESPTKPIAVKIAPDMDDEQLEQLIETLIQCEVSGVIAANTTSSRQFPLIHPRSAETGGLSGKPLKQRSTEMIRRIYKLTKGKLPIIGSGGIFSAQDAYEKIRAGASMVEIYTGMIYEGPNIVADIHRGLNDLLLRDGIAQISLAVGVDAVN